MNAFDNPSRIQELYNEIASDKPLKEIQDAMIKAHAMPRPETAAATIATLPSVPHLFSFACGADPGE